MSSPSKSMICLASNISQQQVSPSYAMFDREHELSAHEYGWQNKADQDISRKWNGRSYRRDVTVSFCENIHLFICLFVPVTYIERLVERTSKRTMERANTTYKV